MRRSRSSCTAELVPYGHPATWPGEGLRGGPSYAEARALLAGGVEAGPGYVLGIDQARSSGWAVVELEQRRCVLSGRAQTCSAQRAALRELKQLPRFSWAAVLVVLEDHRHVPMAKGANTATVLGLGEARGTWKALLSILEQPESQRLLVTPREWRRVLGTRVNLTREAWKAQAKLWATATVGRNVARDDEAEAIGIATWGAWDGLYLWARSERQKSA